MTSQPFLNYFALKSVKVGERDFLQHHQKVVLEYVKQNTDKRGLVVYHETGTGKSILSIALAHSFILASEKYDIIILSPKSLKANYLDQITKYNEIIKPLLNPEDLKETSEKDLETRFNFASYNSSNLIDQIAKIKNKSPINLEHTIFIIDEAHNWNNMIINGSVQSTKLYKEITNTKDIKLFFLSGTPIVNDPFEIVPMFNMIHPGGNLLPVDHTQFYQLYIDKDKKHVENSKNLKCRLYGKISYFGSYNFEINITKPIHRKGFPIQNPLILERVLMSDYQKSRYMIHYVKERATKSQPKKKGIFITKSNVIGTYMVKTRQLSNITYDGDLSDVDMALLCKNLKKHSAKYDKLLRNLKKYPDTLSMIHSFFVNDYGIKLLENILKYKGYRVGVITGKVTSDEQKVILDKFNSYSNKNGKHIQILLLSSVGSEGINLSNITNIHILEPFWNFSKIKQIIARGIRYTGKKEKRVIQPYLYLADIEDNKEGLELTDPFLYRLSMEKAFLVNEFNMMMVESSIDCWIHNTNNRLKCLMCLPTNKSLFIDKDNDNSNLCRDYNIDVKEVVVKDSLYFKGTDGSYYTQSGEYLDRVSDPTK